MLYSLRAYIGAVARQWVVVVMGVVSGIAGLVQSSTGVTLLPTPVFVAVALLALPVAMFLAFHRQRLDAADLQSELDRIRRPGRIVQEFLALHDEADPIASLFSLGLPYEQAALKAAELVYEAWIERCREAMHADRTSYEPRFREAQVIPYGLMSHGMARIAIIDGTWYDHEAGPEYQQRIGRVKSLLREIVDAG